MDSIKSGGSYTDIFYAKICATTKIRTVAGFHVVLETLLFLMINFRGSLYCIISFKVNTTFTWFMEWFAKLSSIWMSQKYITRKSKLVFNMEHCSFLSKKTLSRSLSLRKLNAVKAIIVATSIKQSTCLKWPGVQFPKEANNEIHLS